MCGVWTPCVELLVLATLPVVTLFMATGSGLLRALSIWRGRG